MATTDRPVVVGVFEDHAAAEQAVRELQRAGFSNEQIKYSVNKGGPGILDGLIGMGLPYDEASFYNNEFQTGHTIVAVRTDERQQEAYEILRLSGAYTADAHLNSFEQPHTMQLREEVVHVQKAWVQREEIRIHVRVITEEKVFKVPVRREEVTIERVPLHGQAEQTEIDRDATQQPVVTGDGEGRVIELKDGETFKVQVREERVFIETKPMVVEEIVLTKRMIEETKEITETVQREELRVERKGNVHIQGDNLDDAMIHSYQEE